MANGNGNKKKFKLNTKTLVGIGVVGVGVYLLWRTMRRAPRIVAMPGAIPATPVILPTDSMAPGALPAAAAGLIKDPATGQLVQVTGAARCPPGYVLRGDMCYPIPRLVSAQTPTDVPSGTLVQTAMPPAFALALTPEQYLESLGNPAPRSTVTGLPPPPGLFPEFRGSPGPKQKRCLKETGTWTGPTGKKFCVMPG